MKIIFLTLALFALSIAEAQEINKVVSNNLLPVPEVLEIKEMEHDFGKIPQNKPVYYYFEIVNKGMLPLKLDDVHASCGCTTPEWSRDAIPAGGSQKIKVGYNAASEGSFDKFITITYNGNATKQIKIRGFVWKAPVGSAPTNESIQFLKQQIL